MDQATQTALTSSERTLRSQVAVIEVLGGERLIGSGFEADDPEVEFEERV